MTRSRCKQPWTEGMTSLQMESGSNGESLAAIRLELVLDYHRDEFGFRSGQLGWRYHQTHRMFSSDHRFYLTPDITDATRPRPAGA